MLEQEKKLKELHLQYSVIQAAIKKISELTGETISEDNKNEALYIIDSWAKSQESTLKEVCKKYGVSL